MTPNIICTSTHTVHSLPHYLCTLCGRNAHSPPHNVQPRTMHTLTQYAHCTTHLNIKPLPLHNTLKPQTFPLPSPLPTPIPSVTHTHTPQNWQDILIQSPLLSVTFHSCSRFAWLWEELLFHEPCSMHVVAQRRQLSEGRDRAERTLSHSYMWCR